MKIIKAKKGNKISLIKGVSYVSACGLIDIPKGTVFKVLERMNSDEGIRTVENIECECFLSGLNVSLPYCIFDSDYEIIFDAETVTQELITWIQEEMYRNGGKKVVLGISGGKDSSVVAALCVKALGKENVIGLLMPQGEQYDIKYSLELVELLGIEYYVINIKDMVDTEIEVLEKSLNMELTKETKINIPPRIRMTTLYAVAQNIRGCRVVGTDNSSERYIGYFTKYGDGGYDFNPIADLVVREVKAIGYELELPERYIEKVPEDGLSGQSDEVKIGVSYRVLDEYIRTGKCDDKELKDKIDKMHKYSQHKIETLPYFKIV